MKHLCTSIFFISFLFFSGCKSDKQADQDATETDKALNVQLLCEITNENSESPQNGVFIIVNESKTKIADINACDKISPEDYSNFDIPKEAVVAVGGWWAGSGDYFYVLRQDDGLTVYHAQVDEAQEVEGYRYLPMVSYQNGRFTFGLE